MSSIQSIRIPSALKDRLTRAVEGADPTKYGATAVTDSLLIRVALDEYLTKLEKEPPDHAMQIPAPILEAREHGVETTDPFRDFLREECIRDGEVTRSELYKSYAKWAEGAGKSDRGQGLKTLGQRHFVERLRAEGFTEKSNVYQTDKMSRARGWAGIRLKTEAERRAEAGPLPSRTTSPAQRSRQSGPRSSPTPAP